MKQNKKIVIIFMVFVLLISILTISSFAYTDTSTNGVSLEFLPTFSSEPSISEFLSSGIYAGDINSSATWFIGAEYDQIVAFSYLSGSQYYTVFCNDSSAGAKKYYYAWSTDPSVSYAYTNQTQYVSEYGLNVGTQSRPNSNPQLAVFSSLQDGLSAVRDFIDNPPVSSSSYPLSVQLPAGNILIANVGGITNNHYRLETSGGTTGATAKPGLNNIQIGYLNSIPQTITLPSSLLEYPPYWAGTGKQSIFGTFNRQAYTHTMDGSSTYFVVGNPMYPNDNNASANRLNPDLYITIDSVISYQIIDLKTGYVNGILTGENDGSSYIDYSYDESTGEWVGINQDGNPSSPVWGGQNDFSNTPTTINDWLENIAHQIGDFFTGAIGAVNTLISAGRSFFNVLTGLYSWLPPAVFSVLTSALVIVITIGVVKVFI